jgi:hypothetical protein
MCIDSCDGQDGKLSVCLSYKRRREHSMLGGSQEDLMGDRFTNLLYQDILDTYTCSAMDYYGTGTRL